MASSWETTQSVKGERVEACLRKHVRDPGARESLVPPDEVNVMRSLDALSQAECVRSADSSCVLRYPTRSSEGGDALDLFARNGGSLRRYIRRLVRDADDADDLFQEVGLIVARVGGSWQDGDEFGAWCRGLARNVVKHFVRSRSRRRERLADYALAIRTSSMTASNPEDAAVSRELIVLVSRGTDARSLRLLAERYVLEKNACELARELCRSPAAVRMKLMRTRLHAHQRFRGLERAR